MVCACCGECADGEDCQRWCRATAGIAGPGTPCDEDFSDIDGCVYENDEWTCLKVFESVGPCDENSAVQAWLDSILAICPDLSVGSTKIGYCCDNECRPDPCCPDQDGCRWEYDPDGDAEWVLSEDLCVGSCSCDDAVAPTSTPSVFTEQFTACGEAAAALALSLAGPGTELTKIIAWIGLTPAPGCKCKKRARYMDKMGCDWCEQNMSQIVGWLQEEHARTKSLLPFVPFAAEKLVRLAIRRARQGNS